MRWEDERYVRIYTRDTADWLALSFDAQALFVLLLRKVDRAGLLRLGKHGRRAVAVVLGQTAAWPRLEAALAELLADGCVRLEGEVLVVPNFIEAQEAAMSDRQRKAEQRARARDQATPPRDEVSRNVTGSHEPSREVTGGPTESQEVTPSRAVPCRAEPEEAAAARASARDGAITMTGLGVAEATSPPPVAEATPGPALSNPAPLAAPHELEAPPQGGPVEAPPPPSAEQASDSSTGTAGPEGLAAAASPPTDPTPAAVGHPAEAATPSDQADAGPARRPLRLIDTTDLGPLGAEWRADMEQASGWKIVTAAVGRRDAFKAGLEAAVQALGLERAVAECVRIVRRRMAQGLGPPGSWAFFLPALEEAVAGRELMPPPARNAAFREPPPPARGEVPGPALFSRERWQPLLDRLPPALRDQLCAEAERMVTAVESEGLWTSARNTKLEEVEGFLWTKWERRASAAGGA